MSNVSQHSSAYEGLYAIRTAKMTTHEKRTFRSHGVTWSALTKSNLVKTIIFAVISLLAGVNTTLAAWVASGNGYGPLEWNYAGGHNYESSAVWFSQNNLYVWTCGLSNNGTNWTDAIFLTKFNYDHPTSSNNISWGPGLVLPNTLNGNDSMSACSPSVLYVGPAQYRMYYECGTTLYHPNICFATSPDGGNWSKIGPLLWNPFPPQAPGTATMALDTPQR